MAAEEQLLQPFREHSALLDEHLASFFGPAGASRTGHPGRPDCINEYGSLLEDASGPGPQKWTRLSRMLPSGLNLDVLEETPAPRPGHRSASEPPPQLGTARADPAPAGAAPGPPALQPPRIPRMTIKLGGRVVASTGPGAPKPPMAPPRPLPAAPAVQAILRSLDGLGAVPALVSPLPSTWSASVRGGAGPERRESEPAHPSVRPQEGAPAAKRARRGAVSAAAALPRTDVGTDEQTSASPRAGSLPPRRAASEEPAARCARAGPAHATPAAAPVPRHDDGATNPLGALACALPGVLRGAALPASGGEGVAVLQEQGRKMKRLSERKAAEAGGAGGPRPTHVSAFFLAQAGLKFLASAAALEGERKGAASAPLLYRQTAALLDTAARSAAAASGPPLVTAATALLCERLAAFARLRSAHLRRGELAAAAREFSAAVERGVGETFSRPSPTDSNVSSTLPAGGAGGGPRTPPGARGRADGDGGRGPDDRAAGGPTPGPNDLVAVPRAVLEAQLAAAAEMQHLFSALSGLARSSDRLRAFVQRAEEEGSVAAARAGAAALLAGADGGLGPPAAMLSLAREALDNLKVI
ncbi:hypothetical protein ACKKBF_B02035 [Auxenochlorella protothecoides x Auxenochlorella symbiontica]